MEQKYKFARLLNIARVLTIVNDNNTKKEPNYSHTAFIVLAEKLLKPGFHMIETDRNGSRKIEKDRKIPECTIDFQFLAH